MTQYIDDITHVSRKHEKKINKTILPLKQLGLTYFAMQKVTTDGHWSIISSNPTWIEYSAGHQLYLYDPSLINPKHYDSGICYVDSHDNDDFRNIFMKHCEGIFDLGNALAIIDKNETGCEFTFLSTSVSNKKIINTYLTKFNTIRQFINYFKSVNSELFNQATDRSIDLKKFNKSYSNTTNIIEVSSNVDNKNNLSEHFLFNILSIREKECIKYYLDGKTAKETAVIMGLSYRTIEEYLTNVKKKLGCRHKRDLLALFNK